MKKCCKVLATYFGDRQEQTGSPANAEETLAMMKEVVRRERTMDPGVDLDVIIVNNLNGFKEGDDFIRSLDGTDTYSGKFICKERDNIDISFGAFNYAYEQFKDDYHYWLFLEDDVIMTKPKYYPRIIDIFESDLGIAFVGVVIVIPPQYDPYIWTVGGGCGLTSADYLRQSYAFNGGSLIRSVVGRDGYQYWHTLEAHFTNVYTQMNEKYRLVNVPGWSPYAENWNCHIDQVRRVSQIGFPDLYDEFVYRIGIK